MAHPPLRLINPGCKLPWQRSKTCEMKHLTITESLSPRDFPHPIIHAELSSNVDHFKTNK